jgi:hypothetical protein
MTKPPCKVDGVNCPKRYVGCHTDCETWHEWLAVHAEEKEMREAYRNREADACAFARDTTHRITKRINSRKKVGQR